MNSSLTSPPPPKRSKKNGSRQSLDSTTMDPGQNAWTYFFALNGLKQLAWAQHSLKLKKLEKTLCYPLKHSHLAFSSTFFSFFFRPSFFFLILKGVFIGFYEVLNPFLTFWSWGRYCKPLIRTYWGAI